MSRESNFYRKNQAFNFEIKTKVVGLILPNKLGLILSVKSIIFRVNDLSFKVSDLGFTVKSLIVMVSNWLTF